MRIYEKLPTRYVNFEGPSVLQSGQLPTGEAMLSRSLWNKLCLMFKHPCIWNMNAKCLKSFGDVIMFLNGLMVFCITLLRKLWGIGPYFTSIVTHQIIHSCFIDTLIIFILNNLKKITTKKLCDPLLSIFHIRLQNLHSTFHWTSVDFSLIQI